LTALRILSGLACILPFLLGSPALADKGPAGHYRLSGSPDVASELLIKPDGHFEYFLAAGALDEHAEGYWTLSGSKMHLFTDPKPLPAAFSEGPPSKTDEAKLSVMVVWPGAQKQGIAAIDLTIGFASGDPVTGYTQYYGWSLPEDEKRMPLWIELIEPMHGVVSPRFAIDLARGNALHFTLTPNDFEVFDFQGATVDVLPDQLLIHRNGGEMKFVRSRR
jgi:hypothetical protein